MKDLIILIEIDVGAEVAKNNQQINSGYHILTAVCNYSLLDIGIN